MSARRKLNAACLTGALLIAGLAGVASGSGVVFAVGLAVLVALDVAAGHIRLSRGRRPGR